MPAWRTSANDEPLHEALSDHDNRSCAWPAVGDVERPRRLRGMSPAGDSALRRPWVVPWLDRVLLTDGAARSAHLGFATTVIAQDLPGAGHPLGLVVHDGTCPGRARLAYLSLAVHEVPDMKTKPARPSEGALSAVTASPRTVEKASAALSAGSPITDEVLTQSLGGPPRTPLQDTLHKALMLVIARGVMAPAQSSYRLRGSSRRGVLLIASLAAPFGVAVHSGWLPLL